jgi:hypothetical protein
MPQTVRIIGTLDAVKHIGVQHINEYGAVPLDIGGIKLCRIIC